MADKGNMQATPPQLEAINSTAKNTIVLAPAGSGKTFTLTEAVKKKSGRKIVITFTRAAARELRKRAEIHKVSDNGSFAGTIHSYCYNLLRKRGHHLSIAISKMKELVGDLLSVKPTDFRNDEGSYLSEPEDAVGEFLNIYDKTVVLGLSIEEGFKRFYPETRFVSTLNPSTCYKSYITFYKEKETNQWVTFADLLRLALDELRNKPEMSDFIALDEAQDIDPLQAQIFRELMRHSKQSMMAGDDDQSIYGWRLATLEPLLSWSGKRVLLDCSFRVPERIAQAAKNLIKFNRRRIKKDWMCSEKGGEIIWHNILLDHALEEVIGLMERESISILSRINKTIIGVEEYLKSSGIPYQVIGSTGFFQSDEVVGILDWLRFILWKKNLVKEHPPSEESLALSLHGVGEKRWQKYADGYASGALETLLKEKFPVLLKLLNANPSVIELGDAINTISLSIKKRIDNQITKTIERVFTRYRTNVFEKVKNPNVTLSTIHRFKGKEDKNVMVLNYHYGEMPHKKAYDEEEERRIAYVAITRPKKRLIIHSLPNKHAYFLSEME